ncbi:hypothetical protein O181_133574 [Austropuccinia psidii MF-1]|uniref:Uncharacterized protein n=1 Tax=Austropuccinia psidii MF-1 TaxID=1389203 RepID=A0A9Q3L8S8_9BASI|nr:hypothetical protein [Austropuccinia psidii MF-1]
MQVYLGEDSGTVEYGKELVHRRNRVPVLPSNSIKFAVINTPGRISRQSSAIDFTSHRVNRRRLTRDSPR